MGLYIGIQSIIAGSTFKHLRLPFSFFLMPVFLFALSQAENINWPNTLLAFAILHLMVFPSTNGYNSYQDRDVSSIGGLKHPPAVNRNLFLVTLVLDIFAVLLGLFISLWFSVLVLIFIAMSRAYSARVIRLKKYPIAAFLTVFIFQGAFIYFVSYMAVNGLSPAQTINGQALVCMAVSSFFMGSIYPLTQIYQHKSDKEDGVISLSYLLGYRGTFLFSGLMFSMALALLVIHFLPSDVLALVLLLIFVFPMALKMFQWQKAVAKDATQANFENTMSMNRLSSACMNGFFLLLLISKQLNWF